MDLPWYRLSSHREQNDNSGVRLDENNDQYEQENKVRDCIDTFDVVANSELNDKIRKIVLPDCGFTL